MRSSLLLFCFLLCLIFSVSCTSLHKDFEKEKKGYRHTPSKTLYPSEVGNYSFYDNNVQQALQVDKKARYRSSAIYMDYRSGGQMTSILYRPFARVETLRKPKGVKFQDFVNVQLRRQAGQSSILDDFTSTRKGSKVRVVKLSAQEPFMSYNFVGTGFNERLPSITKLVFIEKGDFVIFMRTAYPASDSSTLAKPNNEFVESFVKAQM